MHQRNSHTLYIYMMNPIILFLLLSQGLILNAQSRNTLYVPYNLNHKWGFADTNGALLIKPVFDSVGLFNKGYACAYKREKVGMINTKGKWIVPAKYKFVEVLDKQNRLFEVTIDVDGKGDDYTRYIGIYKEGVGLIVPVKYSHFQKHSAYRYVMAGYDNKNYILDLKTNHITVFHHKHYFECGCGRYQKRMQRYEAKMLKHEQQIERYLAKRPPLEKIGELNPLWVNGKAGGYIVYDTAFDKKRNKWIKYIDSIPAIYDTIYCIGEYYNYPVVAEDYKMRKFYFVAHNGKWGALNYKGKPVVKPEYSAISLAGESSFSNRLFWVKKNEKQGIISLKGKAIIPCTQDAVEVSCEFRGCYFSVKRNNKWAFVNKQGKWITDYVSDAPILLNYQADMYKYMTILQDGKMGIIDTTGKIIHQAKYDGIEILYNNDFMIVRQGKLYGVKRLSNPNGYSEPQWDTVRTRWANNSPDLFAIRKGELHGVIDPFKGPNERWLYFPIGDSPEFNIEYSISENEKHKFALFGFEKEGKYYFLGENGVKFTNN